MSLLQQYNKIKKSAALYSRYMAPSLIQFVILISFCFLETHIVILHCPHFPVNTARLIQITSAVVYKAHNVPM